MELTNNTSLVILISLINSAKVEIGFSANYFISEDSDKSLRVAESKNRYKNRSLFAKLTYIQSLLEREKDPDESKHPTTDDWLRVLTLSKEEFHTLLKEHDEDNMSSLLNQVKNKIKEGFVLKDKDEYEEWFWELLVKNGIPKLIQKKRGKNVASSNKKSPY